MNQPLLAFYRQTGLDRIGRSFAGTLAMNDRDLERTHDYIQWLFPLGVASSVVPDAPLLDADDVLAFRSEPMLRENLLRALRRMLSFYGLDCDDDDPDEIWIDVTETFGQRKSVWLTPDNHNYRRLTRIMRSLIILGCEPYANALLDCLERLYRQHGGHMGQAALKHWRSACGR